MKKVVLVCLAIICVGMVRAQSGVDFGPKFGLNVTNVSNTDANNKASIHLGAFVHTKLTDLLGLQVELLYSRQGVSDKWKENGQRVKKKMRVNYLNIPVLARLEVLPDFTVDLGPQLGFALNGRWKTKAGGTTVKHRIDNVNVMDVSFALGVSYELDPGLLVSARYTLGMTNVLDKSDFGSTNKNRVFQLSVGYKLDFGQ